MIRRTLPIALTLLLAACPAAPPPPAADAEAAPSADRPPSDGAAADPAGTDPGDDPAATDPDDDPDDPSAIAPDASARADAAPLIPRRVLFGNPSRTSPRLSPDGARLAYLAPSDGVMNIWVAATGDLAAATPVTTDRGRGVRWFTWAHTGGHVLYLRDDRGDENWRLRAVDLASGDDRDLTPYDGVQARLVGHSPRRPDELVVALNRRDPAFHDLYRVAIAGPGEPELIYENREWIGVYVDWDHQVRVAERYDDDGGRVIARALEPGGALEPWLTVPFEDTLATRFIGLSDDGAHAVMLDSRGRDTAALVEVALADGVVDVLGAPTAADASSTVLDPRTGRPLAYAHERLRRAWEVVDDSVRADFARLATLTRGDLLVVDQSADGTAWLVADANDRAPTRYRLYDRRTRELRPVFTDRPELEGASLATMHPVEITSRDGRQLVSYLTLPFGSDTVRPGRPNQPLPMVLVVHGGPWSRDRWGFNATHQWLANRGYAVLSVNFRGSTGFGKAFVNAGDREWGAKMHDDLVDAVGWAVTEEIAQPERVAIYGGSYGGYATLVGMTLTPDLFAAGVDIVGPSNLETLLGTIPPYWAPLRTLFDRRVGELHTEEGRALLRDRSPLHRVDAIRRPLLIAQGANDPRVKQAESDQIVAAMEARGLPVTYALYPDEGHGFVREPNRLSFQALAEVFLARHLGGRYEPLGDDLVGASVVVPSGREHVAGLEAALEARDAAAVAPPPASADPAPAADPALAVPADPTPAPAVPTDPAPAPAAPAPAAPASAPAAPASAAPASAPASPPAAP